MAETITKTVHQYSKGVPAGDMDKLQAIARDYACVKKYVYRRYAGIGSLSKLYPGYTVQNEMTACGLREELNLPSPYFYPAVYEALADIKTGWKLLRKRISSGVSSHEALTEREKHYLRYVLKNDTLFMYIVERKGFEIPGSLQDCVRGKTGQEPLNCRKLHNYVHRQIRKWKPEYEVKAEKTFHVTPKGYRYKDGGIYLATKEPRKRVYLALTDNNRYDRQLGLSLKENFVEIHVPIDVRKKKLPEHVNEIALAQGYYVMFTTAQGKEYGAEYGFKRSEATDYLREVNSRRQKLRALMEHYREIGDWEKARHIEENNLGRQKYDKQKKQQEYSMKAYIHSEINRLLEEENPSVIYIPRYGNNRREENWRPRKVNSRLTSWQRGYISDTLRYKCDIRQIRVVEVNAKGIGITCSICGAGGVRKGGEFRCKSCGRVVKAGRNTAENVYERGHNRNAEG